MLKKLKHIANLYVTNFIFATAFTVLIICAFVSKYFYTHDNLFYADEMQTLFFVIGTWVIFHIGILIKRQIANYRATLFPGYRNAHILMACVVYGLLGAVLWVWNYELQLTYPMSINTIQAVYLLTFVTAFFITYTAYLSIERVIIYTYVLILIMANFVFPIINLLENIPHAKYYIFTVGICGLGLFYFRLLKLNSECFEYNYLLAVLPRKELLNHYRAAKKLKSSGQVSVTMITPFSARKTLFKKSFHWDYFQWVNNKKSAGFIVLLLISIAVILFRNVVLLSEYLVDVYSNFLLLVISPLLMVIFMFYSRLSYWGYDLLKPIDKNDYFKQRFYQMAVWLTVFWLLFAGLITLAYFPSGQILQYFRFGSFLVFSLSISCVLLISLGYLCCVQKDYHVLLIGAGILMFFLLLYSFIQSFTTLHFIGITIISFLVALFFGKHVHAMWCDKEFV